MEDPVSLGLMAASTALNMRAASSQKDAAYADAARLEQMGVARYAQGTREAQEETRAGDIMISDARAAQAAGGGTTTDPAAIQTQASIASDAEYNSLMAMYDAKLEKQGMDSQASSIRKAAKAKARNTKIATALKFATGLWDSFGNKGGAHWTNPNNLKRMRQY